MLRLDRVEEALAAGEALVAGETTLKPLVPACGARPCRRSSTAAALRDDRGADLISFCFATSLSARQSRATTRNCPCRAPPFFIPTALPAAPGRATDPLYVAYHDEEWGVPEYDDRALFEKLILDGFQAGLAWITILRKREPSAPPSTGSSPRSIARYGAAKVEALMADAGIVRNRAKIVGTIDGAKACLDARGARRASSRHSCGTSSTAAPVQNRSASAGRRAGRDDAVAAHLEGSEARAASTSSGRPSSTPSCRRSAWSTTTSSAASATRSAPRSARAGLPMAARSRAARAPGSACCPGRRLDLLDPSPARRRDRRHRPWPGPRRALERPDARARTSSRWRSTRCWSRRSPTRSTPDAAGRRAAGGAAARRARIRDRRHHLALQGGDRRRLQGRRGAAPRGDPPALRPAAATPPAARRA